MTSCTSSGRIPARSTAARMAAAPNSGAVKPLSSPWKPHVGVRARPTMTTGSVLIADLPLLEVDDQAALDVARAHAGEDVVDALEPLGRHGRLHLALAGEVERFLQIEARADDGAAHRDAVQHGVEEGEREVAGRQADQRNRSAAADH